MIQIVTPAALTWRTNAERLGSLIESLQEANFKVRTDLREVNSVDDKIEERVRRQVDANEFANLWMVVMLVTFAETYLQDVLSFLARFEPSVLNKSEQCASFADISDADSLDGLADTLRLRWAQNFLDRSGPQKWLERLTKMGTAPLDVPYVESLEELWGIRHVVIHRAGTTTKDFVRRHPAFCATVGQPLIVTPVHIARYLDSLRQMVESVDNFVVRRLKLVVDDPRLVVN